jgi:dipeptidyl-peptidase-3
LSKAALCGRDILWDQNYKYNLRIRKTFEAIYNSYSGDRQGKEFADFLIYFKRILFSNGIHHHYSMEKILPAFSEECFKELLINSDINTLPIEKEGDLNSFISEIIPIIFSKEIGEKRVVLDEDKDLIISSANNYYEGVDQKEVEHYYSKIKGESNDKLSYGLNSKLFKENGELKEDVWKVGGMYSDAIEKIVYWLEKAKEYAFDDLQKKVVSLLIDYYKTGDLQIFDEYSIEWVKELASPIDFINGFIEVYGDPLAYKGSWESVVQITDEESTERANLLSENAQWFEDNSPVDRKFKKENVSGVSAKVVNVAMLGGDCYPHTPIGINLPNAEWIREEYGSKSVTIENITYAYHQASLTSGMLDEFVLSEKEKEIERKWGYLGGNLHTDLHECLGHGSGKLLLGVGQDALKSYHSTIEEARADLFALYYIMDPKLLELGIVPNMDVAKSEYNSYIRNGLMTQLTRIEMGKDLEESHMRNRQIIAKWAYEKGKEDNVIEKIIRDNKIFYVVNDYEKLRMCFGELLSEIQRIKSEGDYKAAKDLVENYGVKVDAELHREVLKRFKKLNIAPYSGFINPEYEIIKDGDNIVGVDIYYPKSFIDQMIHYGKEYSFL